MKWQGIDWTPNINMQPVIAVPMPMAIEESKSKSKSINNSKETKDNETMQTHTQNEKNDDILFDEMEIPESSIIANIEDPLIQAQEIFNHFIANTSKMPINISSKVKRQIQEKLMQCHTMGIMQCLQS